MWWHILMVIFGRFCGSTELDCFSEWSTTPSSCKRPKTKTKLAVGIVSITKPICLIHCFPTPRFISSNLHSHEISCAFLIHDFMWSCGSTLRSRWTHCRPQTHRPSWSWRLCCVILSHPQLFDSLPLLPLLRAESAIRPLRLYGNTLYYSK